MEREKASIETDGRVIRGSALLLLTVIVVVGTCFAPHVFIALDALVVGVFAWQWYGRSLGT